MGHRMTRGLTDLSRTLKKPTGEGGWAGIVGGVAGARHGKSWLAFHVTNFKIHTLFVVPELADHGDDHWR